MHVHVLEYYSAIKRKVLLTTHSHGDQLQKHDVERSQTEITCWIIPFTRNSRTGETNL